MNYRAIGWNTELRKLGRGAYLMNRRTAIPKVRLNVGVWVFFSSWDTLKISNMKCWLLMFSKFMQREIQPQNL